MIERQLVIDDFAYRCFRDTADEDYVAARMAFHADIKITSVWLAHQAIEKWLKCILLLNRVPAKHIGHNLEAAQKLLKDSGIALDLTNATSGLISYLNEYGIDRYLVVSTMTDTANVVALDRAAWELRRFCTTDMAPRQLSLQNGKVAKKYSLADGLLEKIIENDKHVAKRALVRHNAFWGRPRRKVRVNRSLSFKNATLYLYPELVNDLERFVHIPRDITIAYKELPSSGQLTAT